MSRKSTRIKLYVLLALSVLATSLLRGGYETAQAAASPGVRTEVEFDFSLSSDKKSWIPQVTVYKGDFSTGITTTEHDAYLEKAIPYKNDSSPRCSRDRTALVKGQDGYVAYWVSCYSNKVGKTESETYFLYSFDLATKKWGVVAETPGLEITLFPSFGAYATNPPYDSDSYDIEDLNVKTYDLKTKKLLLKTRDVPRADGESLRYIVYQAEKKPSRNVTELDFKLDKQGRKTNLGNFKGLNYSEPINKKIGSLTYTNYDDKKKKEAFFGFYKGKTFTPLDDPGYDSKVEFSPNDKYLFITEYPSNRNKYAHTVDYKTKIVDPKTGKILHVLPMFNNVNYYFLLDWNYGDEIVRVNFFYKNGSTISGYVQLASGIYTQAPDTRQENELTHHFYAYSGSYEGLLSPLTPGALMIDGQPVVYHGQGAFVAENGKWYVGVQDFADRIGGTVMVGAKDLTLKAGEQSVKIALENSVAAFGKRYASVTELAKGLGYATVLYSGGEMGPRTISIYSANFTEEQFLAQHPEAKVMEDEAGYLKMNGVVPEFVAEDASEYHTYANGGLIDFITFKQGKLHSIETEKSLYAIEKGISYYDPQKKVLKAYGTGKKSTVKYRWNYTADMYVYPYKGYQNIQMIMHGNYIGEFVILDEAPSPSSMEPVHT
ncbi:hypothetical protein [Cohnella yongneupensis]|uniref:Uncharacterized protein n=1 Tax=Cohnella yongneupensis TaxID=425006 RepID=A0ABW0R1I0_9BACL